MAHGDYYDPSNKVVYNNDTANASDLNSINTAVDTAFTTVATDLDSLANDTETWSDLAEAWAIADQGTNPDAAQSTKYSSEANALEAQDWASASDGDFVSGDTIHLADGTTDTTPSAETSADYAKVQADAAAASAASALGANTVSAGDDIRIDSTGSGPYDYEVNNTKGIPTVSAGSNVTVTPTGSGTPASPYDYEVSSPNSRKNFFLNPCFRVKQRGITFSDATQIDEYTLDRWFCNALSEGDPATIDRTYSASIPEGSKYFIEGSTGWAGSPAQLVSVSQRIDSNNSIYLADQEVTLSCRQNTTVAVWKRVPTAKDDYTGYSDTLLTNFTGTSWDKTSVTFTLSLADVTNGISIIFTGVGDISFACPQLEIGSVVTDFEYIPYEEELNECQHYFWQLGTFAATAPVCSMMGRTSALLSGIIQYPTTMRQAPTLSYSGTFNIIGSGTEALSTLALDNTTNINTELKWNDTGTPFTANYSYQLEELTGDYILFDSEIY